MGKIIQKEKVVEIAKLSKIALEDDEIERYAKDLSAILDYINMLEKLDTKNQKPIFRVVDKNNVMRKDIVQDSLNREEVLKNAQNKDLVNFIVKGKIL